MGINGGKNRRPRKRISHTPLHVFAPACIWRQCRRRILFPESPWRQCRRRILFPESPGDSVADAFVYSESLGDSVADAFCFLKALATVLPMHSYTLKALATVSPTHSYTMKALAECLPGERGRRPLRQRGWPRGLTTQSLHKRQKTVYPCAFRIELHVFCDPQWAVKTPESLP